MCSPLVIPGICLGYDVLPGGWWHGDGWVAPLNSSQRDEDEIPKKVNLKRVTDFFQCAADDLFPLERTAMRRNGPPSPMALLMARTSCASLGRLKSRGFRKLRTGCQRDSYQRPSRRRVGASTDAVS